MSYEDARGWSFGHRSASFVPQVDLASGDRAWARNLPFPADDANKYTRGKLVLIAGSERYPGAAVLAARAAQRMGAGYVEVVAPAAIKSTIVAAAPSLVVSASESWNASTIGESEPGKPRAVCIGPGFDVSDQRAAQMVFDTFDAAKCPLIVDGGALSALSQTRAVRYFERRADNGFATVLTPHGGEAARLAAGLGVECGDDATEMAAALAQATGAVVVLKGPDTYLSDGQRAASVLEGTSALAKAGTGDVLAGMVGALLAQGLDAFEAAELACHLHARAGIAAARVLTSICVTPEDVIEFIPQAVGESAVSDSGVIGFA